MLGGDTNETRSPALQGTARPLRRATEQHLEDALSEGMLRNEFVGMNKIVVTVKPANDDRAKASLKLEGAKTESASPEPVAAGHAEGT